MVGSVSDIVTRRVGLDPQSIEQLSYIYVFTDIIAHGGLVIATFMLFMLRLVDMCSWYLLIVSSTSVALSPATLVTTSRCNPHQATLQDLNSYASTGKPPTCNSWLREAYCCSSLGSDTFFVQHGGIKRVRILSRRSGDSCDRAEGGFGKLALLELRRRGKSVGRMAICFYGCGEMRR